MSHLLQIHDALAGAVAGNVLQRQDERPLLTPLIKLVGRRNARKLLRHAGISGIQRMTAEELAAVAAIDPRAAATVSAARDLHIAFAELAMPPVHNADDIVSALPIGLRFLEFEVLLGCILSGGLELRAIVLLGKGGALSTSVRPSDIFRPLVRMGASAFALVHSHPSGDPTPSKGDLEFTRAVEEMGTILGLELVDHIIVASGGTTSFRELGHLQISA